VKAAPHFSFKAFMLKNAKASQATQGLILPRNCGRTVPEWFSQKLRDLDTKLYVVWNPNIDRWIIARCLRPECALSEHKQDECGATLVMRVESEHFGGYSPLGEHVISKLYEMDTWRKYGSHENLVRVTEAEEARQKEKIAQDQKEDIQHCSRDNRRQMNQLHHLVQQHDLRLNK
jgi:hypothetical protein